MFTPVCDSVQRGVCVCLGRHPQADPSGRHPPGTQTLCVFLPRLKELNWSNNFSNNVDTFTSQWPSGFQSPVRNLLKCILVFFVVVFLPRIKELNWSHHFFNNVDKFTSVWPSGFQKSLVHFTSDSNSLTKPLLR